MEKERIALLHADIESQSRQIENIYGKLKERGEGPGQVYLESLAYQLHNLYCAFEDLFKVIAGTFENRIDDQPRYHLELLKRMTISVEGVRPAFLSQECYRLIDNLRAFRHLFRHAYSYELDERKVSLVLEDAIRLKEIYPKDIQTFLNQLKGK